MTPALRKDLRGGVRGTDASTGAPSFAGVALVSLNWALDEMVGVRRPIGSIGADRSSAVQLSSGVSRFAAVRRGDLWYAVRRSGSTRAPRDLRNDFGLVALKVADAGGWRDVLPIRPRTSRRPDSAGPLLRSGGRTLFPLGRSLRVTGSGKVAIGGGYRTSNGSVLRRGERFVFAPTPCGVRITWSTRRGDRYEHSFFFTEPPVRQDRTLTGGGQRVTAGSDFSLTVDRGYSSGTEPRLFRARLSFPAASGRPLSVAVCRG